MDPSSKLKLLTRVHMGTLEVEIKGSNSKSFKLRRVEFQNCKDTKNYFGFQMLIIYDNIIILLLVMVTL